jgi:parallel beta-helix repeat protein
MRLVILITLLLFSYQNNSVAKNYTVSPGSFIQSAIDKAEEGDTVQILPGEYNETITISTPGITLKGFEYEGEYTVFNGMNMGGGFLENAIFITASNVTVQDIKIHSFEKIAIQATDVENLTITGIDISQVKENGIVLTEVSKVFLENCQIRDAQKIGISVQDSSEIVIQESEVFQNVVGIDVRDSIETTLKEIALYHNGVGVFLEGENTEEEIKSSHVSIQYCRFIGNGRKFSSQSKLSGIGLFVNGYDHVDASHSYFESNSTYGIVVRSNEKNGKTFVSNHTYVHHNQYGNNGAEPNAEFLKSFPEATGGDILFDGAGERNQFQEKTDLKTWPEELVQELGGVHTELIHFL